MATYLCPSDSRHACSWEGESDDIFDHFINEHENLLVDNNTVRVDPNTKSENILMFAEDEFFLVQWKKSENHLFIYLRYLGPASLAEKIKYDIDFSVNETHDISGDSYKNIQFGRYEINLNTLGKQYGAIDTIDCTFKFRSKLSKRSLSRRSSKASLHLSNSFVERNACSINEFSFDSQNPSPTQLNGTIEEMEEYMFCTNCSAKLRPPIYLCPSKHNICKDCVITSTDNICSKCNEMVTNDRNIELEELSKKCNHSCSFAKEGCPENGPYEEIKNHESICTYCIYKCPLGCKEKASFNKFKSHLKIIHGSIKMYDQLVADFPRNTSFFMVSHQNGVFYGNSVAVNNKILWNISFCGPAERKYFCELRFKKSKVEKPIFFKKCNELNTVELTFSEMKELKIKDKNAYVLIS